MALLPIQRAHYEPTPETDLVKRNGIGKEESNFDIENNKEDSDKIKPHIKFHAAIVKGVKSDN